MKLIDFGYARFLNQSPAKPDLDELNPFYLAPERFSGACSVQTDLYSVGAMMYHLLYGELPWFLDVSSKRGQDIIDSLLAERDKELLLTKDVKIGREVLEQVNSLFFQLTMIYQCTTPVKSNTKVDVAHGFDKSLAGTYKVTASGWNRRAGAGTGKSILAVMENGEKVQCYGYYNDHNGVKWLYVVYKNIVGYASSKYLSK